MKKVTFTLTAYMEEKDVSRVRADITTIQMDLAARFFREKLAERVVVKTVGFHDTPTKIAITLPTFRQKMKDLKAKITKAVA